MFLSLPLVAVLAVPEPASLPSKPVVDARLVGADRIVIRSSTPIESVHLAELSEWCSYFVSYGPDGRSAIVLIRTRRSPLRVVVETGSLRDLGLVDRHAIEMRNPWAYRPGD